MIKTLVSSFLTCWTVTRLIGFIYAQTIVSQRHLQKEHSSIVCWNAAEYYLCIRALDSGMQCKILKCFVSDNSLSTLTPLVGVTKSIWLVKLSDEVLAWLSVCTEVQMISCFIEIQTGLTVLVLPYPGCPGK